MTVLSVIQDAATVIGLAVPSTVYGSTERELVELGALANEMAQRIAFDTHDWTILKTLKTLTGDASTTSFALPTDYKQMLKDGHLWPSWMAGTPLVHVTDTDEWLAMEVQNITAMPNRWIILGTNTIIKPAPANLATVKYYYLTSAIVDPATGSNKATFTIDTDVFLIDERLLKLAITWQWKANKGRPYAEDLETYETALATRIGTDKGPKKIKVGSQRMPSDVQIAYPGTIS